MRRLVKLFMANDTEQEPLSTNQVERDIISFLLDGKRTLVAAEVSSSMTTVNTTGAPCDSVMARMVVVAVTYDDADIK